MDWWEDDKFKRIIRGYSSWVDQWSLIRKNWGCQSYLLIFMAS